MFVFCVISGIAFWDTHFVEETRKIAYFERVARPRINNRRVPSNHNDTAVFLSAVTTHTSHYAHMSHVFEKAIKYSHGRLVSSAKEIRSKQFFFRLSE